jgi:hypothetical protein
MSFLESYLVYCGSGFWCVFFFVDDGSFVGWFGLHGFAPVGRLHYAGQRGLEFVGLLHLCFICFHQKGMIASKKLRASLPFAARIASEPCVFECVGSVS